MSYTRHWVTHSTISKLWGSMVTIKGAITYFPRVSCYTGPKPYRIYCMAMDVIYIYIYDVVAPQERSVKISLLLRFLVFPHAQC